MKRAHTLIFESYTYTPKGVRFYYVIDGITYSFFNSVDRAKSRLTQEQSDWVTAHVGITYLINLAQVCLPKKIVIQPIPLRKKDITFWDSTYKGLVTERMFLEKLPKTALDVQWICNNTSHVLKEHFVQKGEGILLGMSGGKESLTALEIFSSYKPKLFVLQYHDRDWFHKKLVFDTLQKQYDFIKVNTNISHTIPLQKKYGCSYVNFFLMGQIIFNTLYFADQFKYFIIGNEFSANSINTVYKGLKVNHQFDKSVGFAEKINKYIQSNFSKNFHYFSPFFGLYEYAITRKFLQLKKYHSIWTSCNLGTHTYNFCCDCPKCAFIYLISYPFLSKTVIKKYFWKDMMNNLTLFKPLMDFKAVKPSECVGEKKEVWFALYLLHRQNKDRDSAVMKYFMNNIFPRIKHEITMYEHDLLSEHFNYRYVPDSFKKSVKLFFKG